MKYELIGENDILNIKETIFVNRGVEDIEGFLHPSADNVHSFELLKGIYEAVELFLRHRDLGSRVHIVTDSDVDGFTSAAIIYQYMRDIGFDMSLVTFHVHSGKQHGIILEELEDFKFDLLIVPDAGTNDVKEHEHFKNLGIDVLVLDHHPQTEQSLNSNTIIINPQTCDYPNKNLSGSMVTYKFCQAVDSKIKRVFAEQYLDLGILGLISDSVDSRDSENRFLVIKGLKNVKNKFFKALVKKAEFSTKGLLNYMTVSWYITPTINGMIRIGSMEEKISLFKGMVDDTLQVVHSGKLVYLCDNSSRECTNAKSRQDRLVAKILAEDRIVEGIERVGDSPILIVTTTDLTLKGLVANKLADRVKRPVIVYTMDSDGMCSGSARGYERSQIKDFNEFCVSTGLFEMVQGHPNAFGIKIAKENLDKLVALFPKMGYSEVNTGYPVDFIFKESEIDLGVCREFDKLSECFGQLFKEPSVFIESVKIISEDSFISDKVINIKGKNGIKYCKFHPSEEMQELFKKGGFSIMVIGRVGINDYNGAQTGQVMIQDYEVIEVVEEEDDFMF